MSQMLGMRYSSLVHVRWNCFLVGKRAKQFIAAQHQTVCSLNGSSSCLQGKMSSQAVGCATFSLAVCMHWAHEACHIAVQHMSLKTFPPCFAIQASSDSARTVSARQLHEQQQWDSSQATSGYMRASPFAAWSPAQPELPLPPGDTANQKPPWQSVSRSPSGPARKASSTIPAGRLMSTSASTLNTADSLTTGRMLPTRRDREGQYHVFQTMPSLCLHCMANCSDASCTDVAPCLALTAHHGQSHRYEVSSKLHLAVGSEHFVHVR